MDDAVDRKNPPSLSRPPEHFYGRVLKPVELLEHARYSTVRVVSERLRPFVKRFWSVEWDLPPGERYQTATVSEPTINLTFEYGDIRRANTDGPGFWVTGPVTQRRFDVGLYGRGGVLGVNFHLGATLAFSDQTPASVRDTAAQGRTWFPLLERDLGFAEADTQFASGPKDLGALAESIESWLPSRRPEMTEGYARFNRTVEVLDDPAVTSLSILSDRAGMSQRSLQRTFDRYCGVGVKTILTRARVIDAVRALDRGWNGSLADLASQFGWFDQSHFTSDFHRITGSTPADYVKEGG